MLESKMDEVKNLVTVDHKYTRSCDGEMHR